MINKEELEKQSENKNQTMDIIPLPPPPPPLPTPDLNAAGEQKTLKRKWPTVDTSNTKNKESAAKEDDSNNSMLYMSKWEERSECGFVGLSNQVRATCYLNSLVQTLFMTPELRAMLFKWRYDPELHGKDEEKCISLQLQKLFAGLQLSKRKAVKTKALTKSFGWEGRDAFVQHDVQELCRVLFDALDKFLSPKKLKKENEESKNSEDQKEEVNTVSKLYTGVLEDYITTVETFDGKRHGRSHDVDFMDVQLVIRDVSSVEEALDNFVQPELLNGDNQWRCEALGDKKVDATKGFKFKKLPYLLTLQLKRFDYDPMTWRRVKLGNRVSFPFILDMSKYVQSEKQLNYELFSVLIHSGNANGGHYYAHIKDFKTGKWYEFNDSNVTPIDEEKVKVMFGGEENSKYKGYGSSTNAYMLMYRLIDPEKNLNEVPDDLIQEDIKKEIELDNEQFEKEKEKWKKMQEMIVLRVNYKDLAGNITFSKKDTLEEVTKYIYDLLKKEKAWDNHPYDCFRLRDLNAFTKEPGRAYTGKEHMTLEELGFHTAKQLIVETKLPGTEWPIVIETFEIYIMKLNIETDEFEKPQKLKIRTEARFGELKELLEEEINIPKENQHLVSFFIPNNINQHLVSFFIPNNIRVLEGEDDTPISGDNGIGIKDSVIIYAQYLAPGAKPRILDKLDEQRHRYEIQFNTFENPDSIDQKIHIDCRKTIGDLKKAIAEHLNVKEDEFRMFSGRWRIPLKDPNVVLKDSPEICDGYQLYLEKGRELKPTEVQIELLLHTPLPNEEEVKKEETPSTEDKAEVPQSTEDDSKKSSPPSQNARMEHPTKKRRSNDTNFTLVLKENGKRKEVPITSSADSQSVATTTGAATAQSSSGPKFTANAAIQRLMRKKKEYTLIEKMIVDYNMNFGDFKKLVSEKINIPPEYIRIRGRYALNLGEVFFDETKTLKEICPDLEDGKHFVVQKLTKPEQLIEGDMIISFQRWYPSIYKLGPQQELIINKNTITSTDLLKKRVGEEFGIKEENVAIAIPPHNFAFWTNQESSDISLLNWNIKSSKLIAPPFCLKSGNLLFYKDCTEKEKIPLEELRKAAARTSETREQALKIKTIYDEPKKEESKEKEIKEEKSEEPTNEQEAKQRQELGLD